MDQSAGYRSLQYSSTHPLQILTYPFQRRDPGVEPGELLLDGGDNPTLLCDRWDWNGKVSQILLR